MNVNINLETITPEIARHMLQRNVSNRNLRPTKVEEYAKQMKAGEWQITHQGIAVNHKGELIDGQHRLTAIVKSNKTVQMFVARGFDVDGHDGLMVDTGAKRTLADVYSIDKRIAQVCGLLTRIATKEVRFTYGQAKPFIDEFGADVSLIVKVTTKSIPVITSAPIVAAAVVSRRASMMAGGDGNYAVESYERLRTFDSQNFTNAEKALAGAIMRGDARATEKLNLFAKGLVVFDKGSSGMTRLFATQQRIDSATQIINHIMDQRKARRD